MSPKGDRTHGVTVSQALMVGDVKMPQSRCRGGASLGRKRFDDELLRRLRMLECVQVFSALEDGHFKRDASFRAVKNRATQRWHCCTPVVELELLVTGTKWFDTRCGKGGGGAIDLAMALYKMPFADSVRLLVERGL